MIDTGGAAVGDQKSYLYQFPTAVKAQRAKIDAAARARRVYEAAERKAYATDYNHFDTLNTIVNTFI